jgi:hypothetical protein
MSQLSHGLMQATYDKLLSEVPKYKLITQSVLADRLRVRNPPLPNPACGMEPLGQGSYVGSTRCRLISCGALQHEIRKACVRR